MHPTWAPEAFPKTSIVVLSNLSSMCSVAAVAVVAAPWRRLFDCHLDGWSSVGIPHQEKPATCPRNSPFLSNVVFFSRPQVLQKRTVVIEAFLVLLVHHITRFPGRTSPVRGNVVVLQLEVQPLYVRIREVHVQWHTGTHQNVINCRLQKQSQ
jgi:hypothetical protein